MLVSCGPNLDPFIRPKVAKMGISLSNKIEEEISKVLLKINIKIKTSNNILSRLSQITLTDKQKEDIVDIVRNMNLYQDNFGSHDKNELSHLLMEMDITLEDLKTLEYEVNSDQN